MILLEENIELSILHNNKVLRFNVLERLTDTGMISFKVMYKQEFLYTLVTRNNLDFFRLTLATINGESRYTNDRTLYSKIVVALYSVFLNENPS